MPNSESKEKYIHGFSAKERSRLVEQAAVLAPAVFSGFNLEKSLNLLEIGCGVGAQTKHLLHHWPHLKITGIDQNTSHLSSATQYLSDDISAGKVSLMDANAEALPFKSGSFDAALTIWVLEHASHPGLIAEEALRVLRPGGQLILNEVDNKTFGFTPDNPIIHRWWNKFNDFQQSAGADPFVGQSLGDMVRDTGFSSVIDEPLHLISSKREPDRRLIYLRYLRDLLLSGAEAMTQAGLVDDEEKESLSKEFSLLENQPQVDFQYYAVRVTAIKPSVPA